MATNSTIGKIQKKSDSNNVSKTDDKKEPGTAIKREFPLPHTKGIQHAAKVLNKKEEELAKSVIHEAPAEDFEVFKYNARDFKKLTIEKCSDVIESIKANEQQVPAIVRSNKGQLEVIAGSRRLFSVGHLSLPLKYILVEANNRQAFQISDLENEKRKDTSPWEKYLSYNEIISEEYNAIQKEFAIDNNISTTKLSRLMAFGKINNKILDAYENRSAVPETHPETILKMITHGNNVEKSIIREAEKITKETYQLASDQILIRLRTAANEAIRSQSKTGKKLAKAIVEKTKFGSSKKGAAEIKITPTKITTIRLNKEAWSNKKEAIEAVTALLETSFGED